MGPFPKPPSWDSSAVTFGLTGQAKVDALYPFVLSNIEEELIGAFDIDVEEAEEFRGRGCKPKFVWRQAGGAPSGSHSASNARGRHSRLLERRLSDAISACEKGNWTLLLNSITLAGAQCRELFDRNCSDTWINLFAHGCGSQVIWEMGIVISACKEIADFEEKEASRIRTAGFRKWAKDAVAAGGGAAHAFAKVPKGWKASLVPGGKHPGAGIGLTGDVQSVVDMELQKWAQI